jgi:hypothetical protein
MRITGPGIWGDPPDRDRAKEALRRAVALDVNFIDTADSYGPEVSERLIAEALYPYPEELVIATKGGLVRPGSGRWVPDGRPEYLRRACEGSSTSNASRRSAGACRGDRPGAVRAGARLGRRDRARDRRGGPPAAPAERLRRLPVRAAAMIDAAVELVTRRGVRPRNVYFDAFALTG